MTGNLKPCPFCGWEFAEHAWNEFGEEYRVCDQCGASSGTVDSKWDWQSRPIEDELNRRIAKAKDLLNAEMGMWRSVPTGNLPDHFIQLRQVLDVLDGGGE